MGLKLVITAVAAILGAVIGWMAPRWSHQYITHRECARGKKIEQSARPRWEYIIYMIGGALVCGLAGYLLPLERAVAVCVFAALLLTVSDIDNRCRLIPNPFVLVLLVLGAVYRFWSDGLGAFPSIGLALGFAVVMLVLASLLTRGKNAVGAGDVKLILVMAITAGNPGFFYGIAVMAACMLIYSVIGLFLLRLTRYSYLPMGGSISAGFLASFIIVELLEEIARLIA